MQILRTSKELKAWVTQATQNHTLSLGFVPTMGALHAGHISLINAANTHCDLSIASIFVNPLQFGPNEDLSKYPRTFEQDCELLKKADCDAVFYPSLPTMYPEGASTFVYETQVTQRLEGAFRPGHFQGVATVVAKLFHLVNPSHVFFGQKDAQQCALIQKMIHDLDFDIDMQVVPTLREPDGLAMSSRNRYLTASEREQAAEIFKSFQHIKDRIRNGATDIAALSLAANTYLESHSPIKIQYLELVDPITFAPATQLPARVVFAGILGSTRLIDNEWIAESLITSL